jgi:hypothetical protein
VKINQSVTKARFSPTMAKLCSQNIVLYRIYLEQESAQYWFSIGGTNFINQNYHLIDDAIARFSAHRQYAIAWFSAYQLHAIARFSAHRLYAIARFSANRLYVIARFSANQLYAIARFSARRLYARVRFFSLYSKYAVARRFRSRHIHGSLLPRLHHCPFYAPPTML